MGNNGVVGVEGFFFYLVFVFFGGEWLCAVSCRVVSFDVQCSVV